MTELQGDNPGRRKGFGLGARLRNYFLAGILITAPVGLTIYIAWLFITWVDDGVFALLPPKYNPETYLPFSIPGIGLVIAVVVIIFIGAVTAGLIGRITRQAMEAVLNRVPVIRGVYGAIKQVTETVLANRSAAFRECILVEYPRKGIWTLGFMTGATYTEIVQATGEDMVNVFVPTTPNPTSGFLLFVPRRDIIVLKMPVEDGIKLVISGGMVVPAELPAEENPPSRIAAS
ncbi:MAG TPA: DUF502 domain-containing protein [Dongiaceae bacterium]